MIQNNLAINQEQSFRIDADFSRFLGIVLCSLKLPHTPIFFRYIVKPGESNDRAIEFSDVMLGSIGQMLITEEPNCQTRLSFIPPGYPEQPDIGEFLSPLLKIHQDLPADIRLFLLESRMDKVAERMGPILCRYRMQRHMEFERWFFQRLRIFGYRDQVFHRAPGQDPEPFLFPVQATCAQIAVLARCIAEKWEDKSSSELACLVQDQDTFYQLGNVLPDKAPLNIILNKKRASLKCMIQPGADGQSLMKVIMADWEENWSLWDILRDELERAGYIQIGDPITEKESTSNELNRAISVWVPDKTEYQQILDMWQAGKTVKEIARQTNLTEKTIRNLLTVWRKEYGDGIVPRRR